MSAAEDDTTSPLFRARALREATVLTLHHGYRVAGGEERAAADLSWLAEAELGERVAALERDSGAIGSVRAARGLLRGGLDPDEVAGAVRAAVDGAGNASGVTPVLHAHNLFPTYGPRALEAAREAGAAIVVQLHNYRLACAVATCVRDGHDCTDCSAGNPLPGLRHRCRGSLPEAVAYAAALPRWASRVLAIADVVVAPSDAAAARLKELGLEPANGPVRILGAVAREIAGAGGSLAASGEHALVASRLAPEKNIEAAIDACALAGVPLAIAGDGPLRDALEAHAAAIGSATHFLGRVDQADLEHLRATAGIALSPSLAHETFGLSALESMAAAVPTVGSAVGALPELLGADNVVLPRDVPGLAALISRDWRSAEAGERASARARELCAPAVVAPRLAEIYAEARERRG